MNAKWRRSPYGKEWKAEPKNKSGQTVAWADIAVYDGMYYWQVHLAQGGGLLSGKVSTLAEAKAQALKAAKQGKRN